MRVMTNAGGRNTSPLADRFTDRHHRILSFVAVVVLLLLGMVTGLMARATYNELGPTRTVAVSVSSTTSWEVRSRFGSPQIQYGVIGTLDNGDSLRFRSSGLYEMLGGNDALFTEPLPGTATVVHLTDHIQRISFGNDSATADALGTAERDVSRTERLLVLAVFAVLLLSGFLRARYLFRSVNGRLGSGLRSVAALGASALFVAVFLLG